MDVLFFGDVHGRFGRADKAYDAIVRVYGAPDLLVQVGDFGYYPQLANQKTWKRGFKHPVCFIDGNHDDHESLRELDGELVYATWEYLMRGTIRHGMLFVGGARSINRKRLVRGRTWWPEENISYEEQGRILDAIEDHGPGNIHTVVSHDAPGALDVSEACTHTGVDYIDGNRKFLQHVFDVVRPSHWVFGHYHSKLSGTYKGCDWRCVDMIRNGKSPDFHWLSFDSTT